MPINRSSLGAQSISENTESIIEIRDRQPFVDIPLDPPDVPGRLIGYFNGATGFVELYVVSGSGLQLLRI